MKVFVTGNFSPLWPGITYFYSSLEFDDGEGEEFTEEEEFEENEIKSYDKVPVATNAQNYINNQGLEPEMRKHFDQISPEHRNDIDQTQLREQTLSKSPHRYGSNGTAEKICLKKSSIKTGHSQKIALNNQR